MHYIILRVFDDFNLNSNFYQLSKENTKIVIDMFGDIIRNLKAKWVVLYYIGKYASDTNVYCCSFKRLSIVNGRLRIEFENKKKELKHKNSEFNAELYGLLVRNGVIKKDDRMPYMIFLVENDRSNLNRSLNKTKIMKNDKTIEELKRENDWEGLYNTLGSLEEARNSEKWNDAEYLSEVAFAATQLGFLGKIDKKILKDKEKRKEPLEKLAEYRETAEILYKRCIEIDKDNEVRYLDGLGFIKYQYVLDCLNYRADNSQNIKESFFEAERYYKEVLKIDESRIKNLYRLGYLYVDKSKMVFRNQEDNNQNVDLNKNYVIKYQKEGVEYLLSAIKVYEAMKDEYERKKFRNEYLKSYYTLGSYYADKVKLDFNKFRNLVNGNENISSNYYKDNIKKAYTYLSKCFELQYGEGVESIFNENFEYKIRETYKNWTNEPIEVLYWFGITYMGMYICNRGTNVSREEQQKYVQRSKACFEYAIKLNWVEVNKKTPKNYIEEKLARLYILNGEYDKAVKLLEKYKDKKGVQDYIINTFNFAKWLADNKKIS
ncbi:hypothetical protein [Caloramator proteoclasticus]|uniref:Uncharacterized protein n=1 Tax=Caloramator proteoclasticus DSM 10124 TaxID=1121262 RepID=A0A1M4Z1Y7_9CLOT|nr:hypothetical protein [Caloramator proteoclasticus]SHF11968.1 hypothetical protein SAMN02746091_01806 [Caloramator proteoclasticus DSM 10124]